MKQLDFCKTFQSVLEDCNDEGVSKLCCFWKSILTAFPDFDSKELNISYEFYILLESLAKESFSQIKIFALSIIHLSCKVTHFSYPIDTSSLFPIIAETLRWIMNQDLLKFMKQSNMSILLDTSLSPLWEPIKKNKQEKCSSDSDASLKEFDPMLSRLLCIICSIVSTALDDGAKIPHVAELLFLFTDIRNRFLGQADETSMKCNTVCTRLEVICEGKFTKLQFASSQHQSSEPSSAQSNDNLEKEAKADSPFETSCSTASSSLEPSSSSSAVPMACAPSDYVISPNASFSFDGTKVTNLTEDGNWASFLLPLSHKTGIWQCRVKLLHTTASFLFVGVTKADDHAPLLNCVIGQSEDSISYNAHNGSIFMKKCSHLGLDKSTQGTTIVLEANLEKNPSTFSVSVDGKIQQKIVKELPSPLRFGVTMGSSNDMIDIDELQCEKSQLDDITQEIIEIKR